MPKQDPLGKQDILGRIQYVEENLSKNCDKAYAGVGRNLDIPYTRSLFADSLRNAQVNQHPNEMNPQVPGASATSPAVKHGRIDLWHDFYSIYDADQQAYVLWHEETHNYFQIGDFPTNAPKPGRDFTTQFKPFGYTYEQYGGGSSQFTTWPEAGCHR